MNKKPRSLSILAAALVGTALTLAAQGASAQTITVVSFGGSYQDGQSKALFQPAAKALGITVKEETYTGIADLRLKVKANAVTWDIVASGSGSAARAGAEGILEKLDYRGHRHQGLSCRTSRASIAWAATCSPRSSPGARRPTAPTARRAGPISGT